MRQFIYLSIMISCCQQLDAQTNDITIDMLKSPQSPAANLLGMADSEISKPSDPTSFMLSLRQATNNFTSLPANYAVDFSPYKLLHSRNLHFERWLEGRESFKHNTVLSIAINNNSILNKNAELRPNTALGFGFRCTLVGGKLSRDTRKKMDGVTVILNEINQSLLPQLSTTSALVYRDSLIKYGDSDQINYNAFVHDAYRLLQREAIRISTEKTFASKKNVIAENVDSLRSLILDTDLNRYGWKWNLEGAVAYNFPEASIENNTFSKLGLWTTIGFESLNGFSYLGLARYYYSPNEAITTIDSSAINGLDVGLRLIYEKNKLSISTEVIYRNGSLDIDGSRKSNLKTYKYQINFAYDIGANSQLSLNLGRNFDGTLNNTGNLISALHFIKGFGGNVATPRS
jgi:hypothetical protein